MHYLFGPAGKLPLLPDRAGHYEERLGTGTVQSWKDDQGVSLYDEMNREWKEIQLRRNPVGKSLDSNKQAQIYTASYDLDRFKRFVFESKFLDVFDIPAEEVEKIKTDDVAVMKLGFKYIKYLLMLEETLKVKPGVGKK
jgi:hypothetical protein